MKPYSALGTICESSRGLRFFEALRRTILSERPHVTPRLAGGSASRGSHFPTPADTHTCVTTGRCPNCLNLPR
jgi:hypothetical protein